MKHQLNSRKLILQLGVRGFHRRYVAWALVVAGVMSALFPAMRAAAQTNQVLSGAVPPVVANLQPIGNLDATEVLNLVIGLPLRNQQGLEELLQQIQDPTSANFHQYLTPEQFTEAFGPTAQDYQAVVAFAQANNLTVTYAHPNRVILDVSGTVADIENALHVNMLVYQDPTSERTFYAPDAEPSLNLTVPIQAIEGLNNYPSPGVNCGATPLGNVGNQIAGSGSGSGSGPNGTYWGYDFRDAYLPGVTLTGSGQTVGLLELDGYVVSNITYYENYGSSIGTSNLPNVTLTNVLVDGFSGNPEGVSNNDVEVVLDIDMTIAMAPGLSQIIVYEAPTNDSGNFVDVLNRMADDNLAKQLCSCWFWPNTAANPVAEGIFEQMAAQGQSFFECSGDHDAYSSLVGSIPLPEDSPHITLVGGTELKTSGPESPWEAEAVWNFTFAAGCTNYPGIGSGGGISTQYEIPYWQTNAVTTTNHGSTTWRNVPDVALTADEVFVHTNGSNLCVYGTSCATPLWASLTALVNQQAAANGEPPVGFLNPALYAIGQGSSYTSDCHDITTGNNTNEPVPTNFFAVAGYDLCTGWGTPNGSNLINALSPSGSCLFTTTGTLNTACYSQTATLLPNGLALVAGGLNTSGSPIANAELYYPSNGMWSNTGSLNTARASHTATLLPNGLVLVAGGEGASGVLSSAEIYNPATGEWTNTGSLKFELQNHTATLLPNGLVLVAGGYGTNAGTGGDVIGPLVGGGGGNTSLSAAELYNPTNGTWTTTGSLHTAREYHAATLLPNGLVLADGGLGISTNVLASAELYNPSNGVWTTTGSLNSAREWHRATLLPNGLVLADGGEGTSGVLASAELYYPATGGWTNTGSLNGVREHHTATLLPNGLVLADGGEGSSGSVLTSGELYNPDLGSWTWTCSLNTNRAWHTATLLPNGTVLAAGGSKAGDDALGSAELYPAPLADTNFVTTGSMNLARFAHTATLLPNDLVLVAGGFNPTALSLSNSDLYTQSNVPADGTWSNSGSLNRARDYHTATLLPNDSVLVAGGVDTTSGEGATLQYAELYSPSNGVWTDTGSMHTDRAWHTATLLPNGLVLVAGGDSFSSGVLSSAELYNPAAGTWAITGSLNTGRENHTATLLPNGFVLVSGGSNTSGSVLASAELYNPAAGTWAYTGSLNTNRAWHTATLLPNGLVLVAGGANGSGSVIPGAELYYPATGGWTNTGSLNDARYWHTSTLLPTGFVLVAGGIDVNGPTAMAELYNPAAGTWATTGSLNAQRELHTATLLPSGFVLVAGGDNDNGPTAVAELFWPY
jgi:hypothetical protein